MLRSGCTLSEEPQFGMLTFCVMISLSFPWALSHPDTLMGQAIKHAISSSLNGTTVFVDVTIQTEFLDNEINFLDMLDEVLHDRWDLQFRLDVNVNRKNQQQPVDDYNLWFIDSYQAFWRILPFTREYPGHNPVYYLIVLTVPPLENSTTLMQAIFADMFASTVVHVNIAVEDVDGKVRFYTFLPYEESACRSTKPIEIHSFSKDTTALFDKFFRSKTENLHGCSLRVETRSPVFLRKPKRVKGYLELFGLEVELMNGLITRMNFTPIYSRTFMLEKAGASPNGSTYGPFKALKERKLDFIVGLWMRSPWRDMLLTTTVTYFQSAVVIALKRPPYESKKFSWLLTPFDSTVWLCYLLLLIVSAVCVNLAFRDDRFVKFFNIKPNMSINLNIFGVAIGGGLEQLPSRSFLRLCFIIWIVGALLFRATYEGMLFDSYRRMTLTKRPLTVLELLQQGYTLYLQALFIPMISTIVGVSDIDHEAVSLLEKLDRLPQKSALVASYVFIYLVYTQSEMEGLTIEPVFVEQDCIFLQQHSILTPRLNTIILQMEENGMFLRWTAHHDDLMAMQMSPQNQIIPEARPISLERHKYLFFLYLGMMAVASAVFIAELMWKRVKTLYSKMF